MSNLTNTRRIQPTWHTPPTLDNHLANKAYVDSKTKTLDVKDPCVAATTSNIDNCIYDSLNKTLTSTNNEKLPQIDGVDLVINDRVLIKDQSDKKTNGIYDVVSPDSPWYLRRSSDSNETTKLAPGSFLFVTRGSNYQNVGFILKNVQNALFTLDESEIIFAQMTNKNTASVYNNVKINKSDNQTDTGLELQQDSETKYQIKIDDNNNLKINSSSSNKGLSINSAGLVNVVDNIAIQSDNNSSIDLVNTSNNKNWKISNKVNGSLDFMNQNVSIMNLSNINKGLLSVEGEIVSIKNTISNQITSTGSQNENYGIKIISNKSSASRENTISNIYGAIIDVDDRGVNSDTAVINNCGLKLTSNSSNVSGISKNVGLNINVGGGDFNYPLITQGGYVGLGTNKPKAALEVKNNDLQTMISYDDNSYLTVKVVDNSHTIINTGESGNIVLLPSPGNGNLGVGVIDPKSAIHLSGDIQFSNGGSLKSSQTNEVLSFDNLGNITKLGNSVPQTNTILRWNQKAEWTNQEDLPLKYLWIGDKFKIEETSDGQLKIRKRVVDRVPDAIVSAGGSFDGIKIFLNQPSININQIKLNQWLEYMKSLPGKSDSKLSDIFGDSGNDYQEEKILM